MGLNFFLLPRLNLPSKSWTRARNFLLFKKYFTSHLVGECLLSRWFSSSLKVDRGQSVLLLTIRCRWRETDSEWVSYNPLSLVLPQEVRDGSAGLATHGQSHTRAESGGFIISNDGVKWVWVRRLTYPKKILSVRWNQSPENIYSQPLLFNFLSYFRQNIRLWNINIELCFLWLSSGRYHTPSISNQSIQNPASTWVYRNQTLTQPAGT